MVPRTTNSVVHKETVGKRSAIVRAVGTDREQLVALPDKQHRFIARVTEEHGSVRDRGEFHPLGEVRPAELGLMLAHLVPRVTIR